MDVFSKNEEKKRHGSTEVKINYQKIISYDLRTQNNILGPSFCLSIYYTYLFCSSVKLR